MDKERKGERSRKKIGEGESGGREGERKGCRRMK